MRITFISSNGIENFESINQAASSLYGRQNIDGYLHFVFSGTINDSVFKVFRNVSIQNTINYSINCVFHSGVEYLFSIDYMIISAHDRDMLSESGLHRLLADSLAAARAYYLTPNQYESMVGETLHEIADKIEEETGLNE